MSWRDRARPIIAQVLKDTRGQTDKEIRKALRDAYPFGERRFHPYKMWCSEVRRQTGREAAKSPGGTESIDYAAAEAAGQSVMFGGDE